MERIPVRLQSNRPAEFRPSKPAQSGTFRVTETQLKQELIDPATCDSKLEPVVNAINNVDGLDRTARLALFVDWQLNHATLSKTREGLEKKVAKASGIQPYQVAYFEAKVSEISNSEELRVRIEKEVAPHMLSKRVKQVITLARLGLPNERIANLLSISLQTVKNEITIAHNAYVEFDRPQAKLDALAAVRNELAMYQSDLVGLSPEEYKILHLSFNGLFDDQIAQLTGYARQTVRNKLHDIRKKLGLDKNTARIQLEGQRKSIDAALRRKEEFQAIVNANVPLTPAEQRLALLIAEGKTIREIADSLGFSKAYVKTATSRMRKLYLSHKDSNPAMAA